MTEDAKAIFCRRLRNTRKSKNMTQEMLGVAIGLDESAANTRISRYEKGVHAVEPNTAERIAEVLDMPLAYFYANTEELAQLIHIYHHLDSRQKEELLITAKKFIE